MTMKELQEKRNNLIAESRKILDKADSEKRVMDSAEKAQWDKMNAEISELGAHMRRMNRQKKNEARTKELLENNDLGPSQVGNRNNRKPGNEPVNFNDLVSGWVRMATGRRITNAQKKALQNRSAKINGREAYIPLHKNFNEVKRAVNVLTTGTGSSGGYTIPEGFIAALEVAMLTFDPVSAVADVWRTSAGNPTPWPTGSDTANSGEQLGESTSFGASVDPTMGVVLFGAYKFSSKPIMVPYELLEDTGVNLTQQLGTWLGERLGRIKALRNTLGNGTTQPQGIVTGSVLGHTAADDVTISFDDVIRLEHSVPRAYRMNAGYMCNDAVSLALRLLKDSQGRYLWQASANAGMPDLLNNRPLTINDNMTGTIAASAKTMLCGDFSKFKIREVGTIRLKRLQERYAELDQEAFIGFERMDSKVLDAGAGPIRHLIQAAS
ncbi:phage major capsid protein [Planctopirus limnophila]|nr:phage major capsid protein [Planctopirus limnophila]